MAKRKGNKPITGVDINVIAVIIENINREVDMTSDLALLRVWAKQLYGYIGQVNAYLFDWHGCQEVIGVQTTLDRVRSVFLLVERKIGVIRPQVDPDPVDLIIMLSDQAHAETVTPELHNVTPNASVPQADAKTISTSEIVVDLGVVVPLTLLTCPNDVGASCESKAAKPDGV